MTDKEIMLALLEGKVLQDNAGDAFLRLGKDGYLEAGSQNGQEWQEISSIFCSIPNIGYDYLYRFSKVKD